MKYFSTILINIICFSLLTTTYSQSKTPNDLISQNLKDSVKTLTTLNYDAILQNGEAQKDKLGSIDSTEFNERGNIEKDEYYNKAIDSLSCMTIYSYDNNGNLKESDIYNSDGSLDFKNIYNYDEKGVQKEINVYKSDGTIYFKYALKYDDNGKLVERDVYSESNLVMKYTFKYDNYGNDLEDDVYNQDGNGNYYIGMKYNYKYDDNRNKIEYDIYINDKLSNKFNYKYLDFDKKGNWIRAITYRNDKPVSISERIIEYFGEKTITPNIISEKSNPSQNTEWQNLIIGRNLQNNEIGSNFITDINGSCYLIHAEALYRKSSESGDSWDKVSDNINSISIDPNKPNIFYAVHVETNKTLQVEKSMDGGSNWIVIQNGLPSDVIPLRLLISPFDNSEIYLLTTTGIYKTADAGFTWQPFKIGINPVQFFINSTNKNKFYLLTQEGISISNDAGASWETISNNLPKVLVKGKGRTAKYETVGIWQIINVNYPNSSFLIASTTKGLYKTTNDGKNWIEINNGFNPSDIVETYYISNNEILLGCDEQNKETHNWEGIIYKSDILASKWERIPLNKDDFHGVVGIYKDQKNRGIFFTDNNKIAYLDTNYNVIGLNYGVMSHSYATSFSSCIVDGHKRIYCYVKNINYTDIDTKGLFYSDNNGLTWEKSLIGDIDKPTIYISPFNAKEIRIIDPGQGANYYLTYDGGVTWSHYSLISDYNLTLSWGTVFIYDFLYDPIDKNILYACKGVNENRLFKFKYNAASNDNKWIELNVNAKNIKVNLDDDNKLLTNYLDLSTDGGWTWNSIINNISSIINRDFNGDDTKILYFKGTKIIIRVGNCLLTSDDGGKIWRMLKSFNGNIRFVTINPMNQENIIVIIEKSGFNGLEGLTVLQTSDSINWRQILDYKLPRRYDNWMADYYLGAYFANDKNNKLIYIYGNGGLLCSSDNGQSWQQIGGIREGN